MKHLLCFSALLASAAFALADPPKPMVTEMKMPESVCVGAGGKIYVTEIGDFDKDGDGLVSIIANGKATPFAKGLDDPKGIAALQNLLFVTDKTKVWKIDQTGKAEVFADAKAFPNPPVFLNDIVIDAGVMYVSESGKDGKGGAVYRIPFNAPKKGKEPAPLTAGKITTVVDAAKLPGIHTPNGLLMDGSAYMLMLDFGSGFLYRVKVADGSSEKLVEGFEGGDGLIWDGFGRLFISSWKQGKVWGTPRVGVKPILMLEGLKSAADICIDPAGKNVLVPDMMAGTLVSIPTQIPGWEVDDKPLSVETFVAFPDLKWTGWKPETDAGKASPLRPIVLTHAGDGSNRNFVATEHGVIHVFPNDQKTTETKVFLDIQSRVSYSDSQNEEGFLGLAFHPKYKENGEFFVFYTPKSEKLTNIVSRFKVSKDDPNKADPASEEVLIKFKKPFWNHDGGTIVFGPDGYLYVTHGDGGSGGDPQGNGQKLDTLLGKVLRIDVDKKDTGKNYAIPKDNPFVGQKDALPEIWAYGIRNLWRMAFDKPTGKLWAGEVGQNLWEEVIIVEKGGNYGWSVVESLHPFKGTSQKGMIDPIWEYHHDTVGKSVTGGLVYRGTKNPDLVGHYIYGDYVTTKIWAMVYDEKLKRVTHNRPIKDRGMPIMSFGEDEKGEIYLLTFSASGKGIYGFGKP